MSPGSERHVTEVDQVGARCGSSVGSDVDDAAVVDVEHLVVEHVGRSGR